MAGCVFSKVFLDFLCTLFNSTHTSLNQQGCAVYRYTGGLALISKPLHCSDVIESHNNLCFANETKRKKIKYANIIYFQPILNICTCVLLQYFFVCSCRNDLGLSIDI